MQVLWSCSIDLVWMKSIESKMYSCIREFMNSRLMYSQSKTRLRAHLAHEKDFTLL